MTNVLERKTLDLGAQDYEERLYREYINQELDKSKEKAKDPNTKWISLEEFRAKYKEYLD
ncbi:MAG: hypothetical protein LBE35_02810 [Clostridiales bacterium]|nr:hypothetical protein [Clostridiales bacterium]